MAELITTLRTAGMEGMQAEGIDYEAMVKAAIKSKK
jgi:hypothetical protein